MKGNIRPSPHLRIALSLQNDKYTKAEMFKYKEVEYYLGLLNPIYVLFLIKSYHYHDEHTFSKYIVPENINFQV